MTRDAPRLAAAIVAIHDAHPACRIMLGGNGVPLQWREDPYPCVPDDAAVLDAVEGLLHGPPQELVPMIAQLHSSYAKVALSLPATTGAVEDERLAAEVADTSEVARRYARLAAEYRYLAYRDPLTALPNRRAFDDRMIALSSPGEDNALLVIDVDEFKEINDDQGHEAGDALLRRLGQTIRDAVRAGDTVARIGDDEFTVLLPLCTQTEARHVAEQIRTAVLEMSDGEVTVSIGGAPLGTDRRGAVLDADRALYAAKAAGRNRSELTVP
jgi:diguanylate cyclase (GGDEF)-like protein